MSALITLAAARRDLRIPETGDTGIDAEDDDEIIEKVLQASEIVLDYITTTGADDWTDADCPPEIRAATHMVLRALYDNAAEPMSDPVRALLRRHRDPPLA